MDVFKIDEQNLLVERVKIELNSADENNQMSCTVSWNLEVMLHLFSQYILLYLILNDY